MNTRQEYTNESHGDEHLCTNSDCVGDIDIWCTCMETQAMAFDRMQEDFYMWAVHEGQA